MQEQAQSFNLFNMRPRGTTKSLSFWHLFNQWVEYRLTEAAQHRYTCNYFQRRRRTYQLAKWNERCVFLQLNTKRWVVVHSPVMNEDWSNRLATNWNYWTEKKLCTTKEENLIVSQSEARRYILIITQEGGCCARLFSVCSSKATRDFGRLEQPRLYYENCKKKK